MRWDALQHPRSRPMLSHVEPIASAPEVKIAVVDADARRRAGLCARSDRASVRIEPRESVAALEGELEGLNLLLVHDEQDQVAQAARQSLESGSSLPVIAYAEEPTVDQVVHAMKAGASDYLTLPFEPDSMERIIRQARREAAEADISKSRRRLAKWSIERLSQRERQVLDALSNGLTSHQIAQDLAISTRTVETHRYNLRRKLGSIRTAEAIRLVIELGFPEDNDFLPGGLTKA